MTLRVSYLNYLNAHHYNEDSLQLQAIDYLQQIIIQACNRG